MTNPISLFELIYIFDSLHVIVEKFFEKTFPARGWQPGRLQLNYVIISNSRLYKT